MASAISLKCDAGEFDDNGKCKSCPYHCYSCSVSTACEACESGFYLDKSTNGCIREQIDYCSEIDSA